MWLLSGEGSRYHLLADERILSELSPVELIRRGLERLERSTTEVTLIAPNNLPSEAASDFVALNYYPLAEIAKKMLDPAKVEGYVMAYRQWLPNPESTIGALLPDEAMQPILPAGSIVAIDRSMTDPSRIHGRIVAACPDGVPMIRWLEISGRHLILRPNHPSREFPLIPIELDDQSSSMILGQVVWSWSRFSQA
jgi:hypothetical protein